jgi:SAM-dependent methyltransferase
MNLATEPFNLYNTYYDLLYKDKNYTKEADYVSKIIQKYNPGAKHIIELGSGTGNYSKPLSNIGYTITGIELNEEMNKIASTKSIPNFAPITADIVTFDLPNQYDAVVALFHVISYLNTNHQITGCFKQVAKHLKPKGLFVFDIWYSAAVYTLKLEHRIKKIENETIEITRYANPVIFYEKNIVHVNYEMIIKNKLSNEYEKLNEVHSMRHFSTPEIKLFAELSGFDLIGSEEFLSAKEPSADTWGVCYILQKYE